MERYARRAPRINRLILTAFVLGLPTCKVGKALLHLPGEPVGASTVSKVANPKAVPCLAGDLDALLAHYRFEEPKWRKASRSTNAIERCFVEVRRRTHPMGVMADNTSVERIL